MKNDAFLLLNDRGKGKTVTQITSMRVR